MTTTTKPFKPFGRLGHWADVKTKIEEARLNGATIKHDATAGTVEAGFQGDTLFKALDKGGGAWLVMYNPEYYPR